MLNELIKICKQNGFKTADIKMIKRAFQYAEVAHEGQKRKSGDEYMVHLFATAKTLAKLNMDVETVVSGLLHDVPEDTKFNLVDIEKEFGSEIAKIVAGVTKLGRIKYRGIEKFAENLRKMFVSMAQDIRVIIVKMADRLHNMRTLQYLPKEKQKRIATEVIEIYAPIAHRLGMGKIKGELEDLAFPYAFAKEFQEFQKDILKTYKIRIRYTNDVIQQVKEVLLKNKIRTINIHGRTKHLFSLYKKLQRPEYNKDVQRIYDLVAIRIIVADISECYKVLGIIHQLWKPMPGRIKDYIAQPKPNNYRSIHTTVFGPKKMMVEFQIRSKDMHEEAEFGIAAHWKYKEFEKGSSYRKKESYHHKGYILPKKFDWIEQLAKWQKEIGSSKEFLKELKIDAFQNRILVFTPQGDVIDLPEMATPIDFAYSIHSDVGNHCVGVKINNIMSKVDATLKSGDVIEILTEKNRKGPSRDWLNFVKTHSARSKIRAYFSKQ